MKRESNNEIDKRLKILLDLNITSKPTKAIQYTDEPKVPQYVSYPAISGINVMDGLGKGIAMSEELAKVKAIAECIERISVYRHESFCESVCSDEKMLDPTLFVNFSNRQLDGKRDKFISNARKHKYLCTPAYDWTNNSECLIPAQLIYLTSDFENEPALREQNTNGAAAGFSPDEAFVGGLLELIERDTFMITYLKQLTPPRIDYSSSDRLTKLAKYFRRYNLDFHLFDITLDLEVPVVMALNIDRTGIGPAINLGLGCDFDMETAAEKASLESVLARNYFRLKKEMEGFSKPTNPSEIKDLEERGWYWYDTNNIDFIENWLNTKNSAKLKNLDIKSADKLKTILAIVKEHNYQAISVDITPNFLQNKDIKVIKAIVPELHPFYLEENFKALYSIHAGEIKEKDLPPQPFL